MACFDRVVFISKSSSSSSSSVPSPTSLASIDQEKNSENSSVSLSLSPSLSLCIGIAGEQESSLSTSLSSSSPSPHPPPPSLPIPSSLPILPSPLPFSSVPVGTGSLSPYSTSLCFLFLHGAGSSKETWHNQINELKKYVLCIAPDLRGHGESSDCSSISLSLLVEDVIDILFELSDLIGTRQIVIIAHSVGGAIGTQVSMNEKVKDKIRATIILDLVEDTAIESLAHMKMALTKWPNSFPSIESCVDFSVQQHRPASRFSAQVSIPSLLKYDDQTNSFHWKTSLLKYESDWYGWFTNFNESFLALPHPHCLVVASVDRLDGKMSAAHMEGRYELHITRGGHGGHFIQEDNPGELIGIITRFLKAKGILSNEIAHRLLTNGITTTAILSPVGCGVGFDSLGPIGLPGMGSTQRGGSWNTHQMVKNDEYRSGMYRSPIAKDFS
jgi:pimeloyl-ACP methyl ester carboxylesterase